MSFCTATVTAENMYRGRPFELYVQVFDEDGSPKAVTNEECILLLASSWTAGPPLLQKEGVVISGAKGIYSFTFAVEDTAHFITGGYDLTILFENEVIFHGRYGILGSVDKEVTPP